LRRATRGSGAGTERGRAGPRGPGSASGAPQGAGPAPCDSLAVVVAALVLGVDLFLDLVVEAVDGVLALLDLLVRGAPVAVLVVATGGGAAQCEEGGHRQGCGSSDHV